MKSTQSERNHCALTIAGSDSGGGAGIQADLKTFCANGVYGTTVLTMVTAQSTSAVDHVHLLPPELVINQLTTVFADFDIRALKTGALGNREIITAVAGFLSNYPGVKVVIDPVMISKHGHALLPEDSVDSLRELLLPQAFLVTPNLLEAQVLANCPKITNRAEMLGAAKAICETGCQAVVIKGGHREGDPIDLLWDGKDDHWYSSERIDTPHTHGTGCTFSAAITAELVKGNTLHEAVRRAKDYITGAIIHNQVFGKGINPVNHFWETEKRFGTLG